MPRTRQVQTYNRREVERTKRLAAQCADLGLDTFGSEYLLNRRLQIYEERQRGGNPKNDPTLSDPAKLWRVSRKSAPSLGPTTKVREIRQKAAEAANHRMEAEDEDEVSTISEGSKDTIYSSFSNSDERDNKYRPKFALKKNTKRERARSPNPASLSQEFASETPSPDSKPAAKKARGDTVNKIEIENATKGESKPRKAWRGVARARQSVTFRLLVFVVLTSH